MTTSPDLRSGVAVLDKPAGWTSHQVVGRVRRLAGTRKVGHAGTLDPMATGVLVVGLNAATRLLGHLTLTEKAYAATIRLGRATVTDDAEGQPTATPGAEGVADDAIEAGLVALRGEITQVPSAVSAIKVDGVRSYARVRSGEAVVLAARPVTVRRLERVDRRDVTVDGIPCVDLDVEVECTSGTYIRALARDLGAGLGTGGHLTALRRTRVGPFGLDRAQSLEAAERDGVALIGMAQVAAASFSTLTLDERQATAVQHGRRLPGLALPGDPTALLGPGGEFLALYRRRGADAVADAVFVR